MSNSKKVLRKKTAELKVFIFLLAPSDADFISNVDQQLTNDIALSDQEVARLNALAERYEVTV